MKGGLELSFNGSLLNTAYTYNSDIQHYAHSFEHFKKVLQTTRLEKLINDQVNQTHFLKRNETLQRKKQLFAGKYTNHVTSKVLQIVIKMQIENQCNEDKTGYNLFNQIKYGMAAVNVGSKVCVHCTM